MSFAIDKMQKIFKLIVILVTSQLCLAQNGYQYSRPGNALTTAQAPIPSVTNGFPASPVSRIATPTPFIATTSGFGGTNYPVPGIPSGPAYSTGGTTIPATRQQAKTIGSSQGTGFGFNPSGPETGFPTSSGSQSSARRPSTSAISNVGFQNTGFNNVQFSRSGEKQNSGNYEGGDYSAIPGEPAKDYPIYAEVPQTSFDCRSQPFPGYYADIEAQCQVFHICSMNRTYDFLCPNGTIFSQEDYVCVWWYQFDCNLATDLYYKNELIYSTPAPSLQTENYQLNIAGGGQTLQQGSSGSTFTGGRRTGISAPLRTSGRIAPLQSNGYQGTTVPAAAPSFVSASQPSGPAVPFPSTGVSQQGQAVTFPIANGQQGLPYSGAQLPNRSGSGPATFTSPQVSGSTVGFPSTSGPGFVVPNAPQIPSREYLPPTTS